MARHHSDVQVRWGDMDALGHVNNVVYLRYLQEARVAMLFVHAESQGAGDLAEGVVVARHEITYRAPLVYRPAPVTVETWVREVRPSSFTLGYEVLDVDPDTGERIVYATATSTLVPFDLGAGRPRRVRDEERAFLAAHLEEDGPTPAKGTPTASSSGFEETVGEPKRHRYPCEVRFDDLDSYGHVNNVTYAEYLQESRIEFAYRYLSGIGDLSKGSVVAYQSLDYVVPVESRTDPLLVEAGVTRVGRSSFDITYEVFAEDDVVARGLTTLVSWDMDSGQPRPLFDDERAAMLDLAGVPG